VAAAFTGRAKFATKGRRASFATPPACFCLLPSKQASKTMQRIQAYRGPRRKSAKSWVQSHKCGLEFGDAWDGRPISSMGLPRGLDGV